MSKTLHTTGLLKSVTVLSLATGVVLGGKYIIDMNKPSSENNIISSTTTREETYQDKKIVENNSNLSSNSKTEEKTVPKTNNSSENSIESNQQKLTKNDDSVKNDNEVETVLVNNSYSNSISSNPNNISEMTIEAQKDKEDYSNSNTSKIQSELSEPTSNVNSNNVPEAIVSKKGEALVQPELPEYTGEITTKGTQEEGHKGESLIQPELPEFNGGVNPNEAPSVDVPEAIVSEKGEALVQPELPEYHISEKGESLVQPELPEFNGGVNPNEAPSVDVPEAIVSEKGEALVQPELPEYHISEKGESLVQPELPEFNGGVNPNEAPSVDVPEYKIKTVKREDVTTLTPSYVRMANMKLNEGETQITHNGKNGSLTKVYEDIVGEDGKILKSTLLSENRVEPEIKVIRYGTKKSGENLGETGLYRLSEHTKDIDIVAFNQNIKLNGNEMKSLGQNELYKRSQTDIENNLFLAGKPGWYIIANAPLSEESIKKLNDGSYINHKNVGQEMLKLVNEERKRVGKKTLKWSNGLYELSKIRAKELGENGNIRYYNSNNEELKHSRDENGTKWFTVAKGSSFQGRVLGENLSGYTLPRNIYKVFSEKAIAEQLFNQWKASKGHYANMIDSDYTEFGFDFALSSFWRTNHTNIDYLAQGLQGVQLFAV